MLENDIDPATLRPGLSDYILHYADTGKALFYLQVLLGEGGLNPAACW